MQLQVQCVTQSNSYIERVSVFASIALVILTAGLVWFTKKLVESTKLLAEVGEKTWKSAVEVEMIIRANTETRLKKELIEFSVLNVCGVDIENVFVHIRPVTLGGNEGDAGVLRSGELVNIDIDNLKAHGRSTQRINSEIIAKAIQLYNDELSIGHVESCPGIRIIVVAAHSITKHRYDISIEYRILDKEETYKLVLARTEKTKRLQESLSE